MPASALSSAPRPHPSWSHPSWCDQSSCTVADSWPYGCHQSASVVVPADRPVTTVAELHLVSTMRGLSPHTLLMLELDTDRAADPDESPSLFPLTLGQARELHTALDKLLAASFST
jgi:hypothetical protein